MIWHPTIYSASHIYLVVGSGYVPPLISSWSSWRTRDTDTLAIGGDVFAADDLLFRRNPQSPVQQHANPDGDGAVRGFGHERDVGYRVVKPGHLGDAIDRLGLTWTAVTGADGDGAGDCLGQVIAFPLRSASIGRSLKLCVGLGTGP